MDKSYVEAAETEDEAGQPATREYGLLRGNIGGTQPGVCIWPGQGQTIFISSSRTNLNPKSHDVHIVADEASLDLLDRGQPWRPCQPNARFLLE